MAAGDLTSFANVQAQVVGAGGVLSAASTTQINNLITAISAFIAKFTDLNFTGVVSATEIRDGSGGRELYLANQPVAAITSLTVDGISIPAQSADLQPGYFLAGEVLCLYGYTFCRGRKNVRVTYTSGFSAVPKDIEQACIEIVISAYKRVPRGPDIVSETQKVTGAVFSFSQKDVPPFAARILQNYRKVVPL